MSRKLLPLVGVVLSLAVGCAGSDSPSVDDYEESVVDTRNRVDAALAEITEAQSRQDFLRRMDAAAVVIKRAADDLDEEEVAEGFEDETKKLVAALRALSTDLRLTADQMRQPGFESLFNSRGINFGSWTKADRVLRDLSRQGVDVRPLERH
jgi:hypothetical protein